MKKQFIHLHCHTDYSLLEGAIQTKKLLQRCVEFDMPAVAITDNGVMYGVIDMYTQARSHGIKPIIGCELYLTADITKKTRALDRVILLCRNLTGYRNLTELVTISYLEGFYYKPRIDMANLARFSDGLIAVSPGGRGPVGYNLRTDNIDKARQIAREFKSIYGEGFYLGVQKLGMPVEDIINDSTVSLSKELNIPLVATNDVYYLEKDDSFLTDVLVCIRTGKKLEDSSRLRFESTDMYFKSSEEMAALFSDLPEAVDNTCRIAELCNLDIATEQVRLPHFNCPDNKSSTEYMEDLVWSGIKNKYGQITEEIKQRVDFELGIINKMHYSIYFLIIYDFLKYARDQGIPVGPGRGSAAGSIVAYALDITRIDPLKYKLFFERFLNPERVSMPDVDLDFCIRRRQEVINYIVKKYGEDHVSQIATFGTMAARGVIRDVGRVLDISLSDVDRIAKLIPSTPGSYMSIPEAVNNIPELKRMYAGSDIFKELLDIGTKLEGFSRHTSTHAAGIVISREPLTTIVPLMKNEGQVVTQYQMTDVEKIGLLKMDILGLRNLTVIKDALDLIKVNRSVDIDIDDLPDDRKTYEMLSTGETTGIFQLESRGMRALIKDLQPAVFEDLIALLALYRPGPLGSGMVNDFISNKSGKTKVTYDLPELEPILEPTYGMIVYQEQVMQIASVIGSFTLGEADMLRRAMGKKKKTVMDKMKEKFLDGARKKQLPLQKAKRIFELCYKFAEYGFNKSHSAAYAQISYQTAFLKTHYPEEYMAALLSSVLDSSDKVSLYIKECKRMKIDVYPPDVNESGINFTIGSGNGQVLEGRRGIRFGLGAIKNVGEGAIESIIKNRSEKPYKDLIDFCVRVDLRQVNKRVIESCIKCGAMDSFAERSELLAVYEKTLDSAQTIAKEISSGQTTIFGLGNGHDYRSEQIKVTGYHEFSERELLLMEKEMLGLYVTGHPLNLVHDKLAKMDFNSSNITAEMNDKSICVMGLLTEVRKVISKKKKEMIISSIEDSNGIITVLLFQKKNFEEQAALFLEDNIVYIKGKVRVNQGEVSIVCEEINSLEDGLKNRRLYIDIENIDDMSIFNEIKRIAVHNKGSLPVLFKEGDVTVIANRKFWIAENDNSIELIRNIVGPGHCWVI
ncbi:MAG: DNA polymerase III subunit alpha [bacterium]|nr:DNA polymerase III subunit alpha [bacterium]